MSTVNLSLSAMLSGVLVAAVAVAGALAPGLAENYDLVSAGDYAVQLAIVLSGLLALGGLVGIRLAQIDRPGFGRLGRTGSLLAIAGQATILVANVTVLGTGEPVMFLHALGFLAFFAGAVVLAIATSRVRLLPRWSAALLGATPIILFAGPLGGIAFGVSWIAIGRALGVATRHAS
jgi:hypothetical protein